MVTIINVFIFADGKDRNQRHTSRGIKRSTSATPQQGEYCGFLGKYDKVYCVNVEYYMVQKKKRIVIPKVLLLHLSIKYNRVP